MTLFDKLYNIKEEAAKSLKKPFVKNKVQRAFDAAVDSLESKKIDFQEKADSLLTDIANGNTDNIPELINTQLDLQEVQTQINVAKVLRDQMFKNEK